MTSRFAFLALMTLVGIGPPAGIQMRTELSAHPAAAGSTLRVTQTGVSEPPVEKFVLENGLTVLAKREPGLPLVHVACMYRAGSVNEAPGITGIAHFVEHMCFRATQGVSKEDITGSIDRIGGRWNGYTSLDQTYYAATVPSWALEQQLHLQAERMSKALFVPADFESERGSVISELREYENDPEFSLWNLALATSFEIHPYRYNITGWLDDLHNITRDQGYAFYKSRYAPNNAVVAIVGDFDPGQVRRLVDKHFGNLRPLPQRPDAAAREPLQSGEKRVRLLHPSGAHEILTVYRAPAAADPDFPSLLVLDAVLAGGRSLLALPGPESSPSISLLSETARDAGGFAAASALTATRFPYVYSLGARASDESALHRIEAGIDALLKRIQQDGVEPQELERAKTRLRAANALESRLADQAHRLVYYETLGSWNLAQSILDRAAQVGSEDLRAFVGKWLRPERRTVALLVQKETQQLNNSTTQQEEAGGESGNSQLATHNSQTGAGGTEQLANSSTQQGAKKRSFPPQQALQPLPRPSIRNESRRLDNGVHIAAARRPGKSATIYLRLALGTRLDPPDKAGLSRAAVRLMTQAPASRQEIEKLGGVIHSQAEDAPSCRDREYFDLSIRFLNEQRQKVLEYLRDVLAPPQVGMDARFRPEQALPFIRQATPEAVSRVLESMRSQAAALQDDAVWRAGAAAEEGLGEGFAKQPASSISAEDVRSYLEEYWRGEAVWIAIVEQEFPRGGLAALTGVAGPYPFTGSSRDLQGGFAEPPPGRVTPASAPSADQEPGTAGKRTAPAVRRIPLPGKTQVEITVALPAAGHDDPDFPPLQLLNFILGETGYAGRLGDALVDTGLAYSVYAQLGSGHAACPWRIETASSVQNAERTLDSIRSVLDKLRQQGVQEAEVEQAQAFRLGRLVYGLESNLGLARTLVESAYFGEDLLDFPAISSRILSVKREDLNRAAQRYLRVEILSPAMAGAIHKENKQR